jgi:hypothetical protein
MVAADGGDPFLEKLTIRRRTARDEHACAVPGEFARDAAADAPGGARNDSYSAP